jgi:CubicO group peptidase (beta-lactamase class C family)
VFFDCMAGWNVRYAIRVITHGDSSPSDIQWRPQTITAATDPAAWRSAGDCAEFGALPTAGAQSLVVVHDGKIVCEWYGNGGAPDRRHAAFSISKTIVSLLVSREIAEGRIPNLDVKVTSAIPELRAKDRRFDAISLADLIDMRSGIGFSDDISFPWVNRDYPSVYYSTDLTALITTRPAIATEPGTFTYNDYAPNLVGLATERLTGQKLTSGPLQQLWNAIGAEYPASWATDDLGFPHYESGLAVTARDLARIGQLMLGKSSIEGRPVAPAAFLQRSFDTAGAKPATTFKDVTVGYRNGWWNLPAPNGTRDLAAMGAHGQIMLVSPATSTVIVRLGNDNPPLTNIDLAQQLQTLAQHVHRRLG